MLSECIMQDLLSGSEMFDGDILNKCQLRFKREKVSGIYLMYDKDNIPLYVGQTINFKNRLYSHFGKHDQNSSKFIDFVATLKIIVIDASLLNEYEDAFISYIKPCFNGLGSGIFETRYGYESLYEKKKKAKTKDEIESLIYSWGIPQRKIDNSGGISMSIEKQSDKVIKAIRESIKLAVRYADDEMVDDIIDGLLESVKAS